MYVSKKAHWNEQRVKALLSGTTAAGYPERPEAVVAALATVYDNQTADEQSAEYTKYQNSRGFTERDAEFGTSLVKQYLAGRGWSVKQWESAQKMVLRYWSQFAVALEQERVQKGASVPASAPTGSSQRPTPPPGTRLLPDGNLVDTSTGEIIEQTGEPDHADKFTWKKGDLKKLDRTHVAADPERHYDAPLFAEEPPDIAAEREDAERKGPRPPFPFTPARIQTANISAQAGTEYSGQGHEATTTTDDEWPVTWQPGDPHYDPEQTDAAPYRTLEQVSAECRNDAECILASREFQRLQDVMDDEEQAWLRLMFRTHEHDHTAEDGTGQLITRLAPHLLNTPLKRLQAEHFEAEVKRRHVLSVLGITPEHPSFVSYAKKFDQQYGHDSQAWERFKAGEGYQQFLSYEADQHGQRIVARAKRKGVQ